jgi:hypothetical protein
MNLRLIVTINDSEVTILCKSVFSVLLCNLCMFKLFLLINCTLKLTIKNSLC